MRHSTLEDYKRKRNFKITPEPEGGPTLESGDYMIHKHDARRLHYDLRLEWEGVLKSWAVPKGPSLDPSVKRLAVQVEDHPSDYKSFEGVIPVGEYGAGPSLIWDAGSWIPLVDDVEKALTKGHLKFFLDGIKLKGTWNLVRLKTEEKKPQWLLIKERDEFASLENGFDPITEWPESVATGRSLEDLSKEGETPVEESVSENQTYAKAQAKIKHKGRGRGTARAGTKSKNEDANTIEKKDEDENEEYENEIDENHVGKQNNIDLSLAEETDIQDYRPQLAILSSSMPSGKNWIFERKYDGYRLLIYKLGDEVKIISRNMINWTDRVTFLRKEVSKAPIETFVIDGELVHEDKDGFISFQRLQNRLEDQLEKSLAFYAFDILYLNGVDLTHVELGSRRKVLEAFFDEVNVFRKIHLSPLLEIHGTDAFSQACAMGWEGLIAKDLTAGYAQKRSSSWLKIKCTHRDEYIVVGYKKAESGRSYFRSLIIAGYEDGQLVHRGRVGTGFTEKSLRQVYDKMKPLKTDHPPPGLLMEPTEQKNVQWIEPRLVAEVEYTEQTSDGKLRHPSFKGLRTDKTAHSLKQQELTSDVDNPSPKIQLSHPEKVLFPAIGVTKKDLADYYTIVGPYILPYIFRRYISVVRCPQDVTNPCFFQKHMDFKGEGGPPQALIKEKEGKGSYVYITSLKDILDLVQLDTIEIHCWNTVHGQTNTTNVLVFDLDPGPGIQFKQIVQTALQLHQVLDDLNLKNFVRTTGKKGLHVVVPIEPVSWELSKDFTAEVAKYILKKDPQLLTVNMSKSKRHNRIFIDTVRNRFGATSICSYSTRITESATVATPLDWRELKPNLDPKQFTLHSLPHRLESLKRDPWQEFYDCRQSLPF